MPTSSSSPNDSQGLPGSSGPSGQTTKEALNASLISGSNAKSLPVVERALELGADPNCMDSFGLTALHRAASSNDVRMIQVLIRYGAQSNLASRTGFSPFCSAAVSGRMEAMQLLSAYCMDLNESPPGVRSPLELALFSGKGDVAHWLIDNGADMRCANSIGDTMIMRMLICGRDDAAIALAENGAEVNDDVLRIALSESPSSTYRALKIWHQAGSSNLSRRQFLGPDEEDDLSDIDDVYAADIALMAQANSDFVRDVMHDGGNDLARRKARSTAVILVQSLKRAFHRFSRSSVRLKDGALDVAQDLVNTFGMTSAAQKHRTTQAFLSLLALGHVAQASELLRTRTLLIDLDARSREGFTALQLLARAAILVCVPAKGENFNGKLSPTEHYVREIAQAIDGQLPVRSHLHARFQASGNTALHELIEAGMASLAMHLLSLDSFKAMVNTSNLALERPLHQAVTKGDPHLMSALVEAGANLNAFDRRGNTPLHTATFMLERHCTETAISLGANIHLATRGGITVNQILQQRKGQSQMLQSMIDARRVIESAKSIFSSNNPMSQAVRAKKKVAPASPAKKPGSPGKAS